MEVKLQQKCNKFLRDIGLLHFHDEKGRGKGRRHRGGLPDLVVLHVPVTAFELKTSSGRVKPEQLEYHSKLREGGIEVHIIRDYETFTEKIEEIYEIQKY
jgi:hypothetical protein